MRTHRRVHTYTHGYNASEFLETTSNYISKIGLSEKVIFKPKLEGCIEIDHTNIWNYKKPKS